MKNYSLICIVILSFLISSCSSTDEKLNLYFKALIDGNKIIEFPYKLSDLDTVCVLQAYQRRVKSSHEVPGVQLINNQLDKAGFRGEESAWVLIRYSEGVMFVSKVDRYKVSLASPQDSDYEEWKTEAGENSVECATGSQLKFSAFVNKATGGRRVGIALASGE